MTERPLIPESIFHPIFPLLQTAWDNTSLVLLKECPRKYQYAILEGYRPRHKAPPLYFGGMFHACLEVYDNLRGRGEEHFTAQMAMVKGAMQLTATMIPAHDEDVADPETGELVTKHVPEGFSLWSSDDPTRSRESLVRSLVWYTEHYKDDVLKTYIFPDGTPAIELPFRFDLPIETPTGDPYIYCGTIDKVAEMAQHLWNVERKHTKNTMGSGYFRGYNPNAQVTGYSFAGKVILHAPVSGTIVDATQVTVGFNRFMRHIASRNEEQLNEWLVNTLHWIKQAETYARQEFWPMNEESCHKYSGCQFIGICSKSPGSRAGWLEKDFIKNPWNPLKEKKEEVDA
jgi:hypothetical protein